MEMLSSSRRGSKSLRGSVGSKSLRASLISSLHSNTPLATDDDGDKSICFCLLHYQQSPHMPWQHEVLLTPYEKWVYYRVIPFKLIVHVCLCVITLIFAATTVQVDSHYYRNTLSMFCNRVMSDGTDCQYGSDKFADNILGNPIYTQEELLLSTKKAIDGVCRNYDEGVDEYLNLPNLTSGDHHSLPQSSIWEWHQIEKNKIQLSNTETPGESIRYKFAVEYKVTNIPLNCSKLSPFEITGGNGGVTNQSEKTTIRANILNTQKLIMKGSFANYELSSNRATCLVWDYQVVWDFTFRGIIRSTVHISDVSVCEDNPTDFEWTDLSILICSALVFMLNGRSIIRRARLAHTIRDQSVVENVSQATSPNNERYLKTTLSCFGKLHAFIPSDFIYLTIGSGLLMYHSLRNILIGFSMTPESAIQKYLLGFALLLVFYQVKRYLLFIGGEDSRGTFLLFYVLEKAAPRVLWFLVSILPVLLGYVLCGTIMFGGKLRLFESMSQTLATLFCIANGDSMVNIFEAVAWSDGWAGYVYLYSWCSLVIFVIVNIFLVIVQQTYEDIARHDENVLNHTELQNTDKIGNENLEDLETQIDGANMDESFEEKSSQSPESSRSRSSTLPESTSGVSAFTLKQKTMSRTFSTRSIIPPLPRVRGTAVSFSATPRTMPGTEFDNLITFIES